MNDNGRLAQCAQIWTIRIPSRGLNRITIPPEKVAEVVPESNYGIQEKNVIAEITKRGFKKRDRKLTQLNIGI